MLELDEASQSQAARGQPSVFNTSLAVGEGASNEWISVSNGLHFNVPLAFVALALMALAEIFRRGAELEDEQALVV
ncbi:MAG TPA: hypothetical protein VLE53_06825 [Gemmatimonadaceae bacterium]|nr:hypothetical protein [Gemmatimonadaceae bacterium]